jgi:hypothetical protein
MGSVERGFERERGFAVAFLLLLTMTVRVSMRKTPEAR